VAVSGIYYQKDKTKNAFIDQEQPLVAPQVEHLRQEPLRTIVNCWQVWHASPS